MHHPQQPTRSPEIAALLARLRRRIRAYVWLEGLAALVAVAGIAFWLGLAIDWIAEPSPPVRVVGLALAGIALLVVLYRTVLSRTFAKLSDTSMAVLLEKYSPEFHDSLLTSVELENQPERASIFNAEMLAHTREEATERATQARLNDVFNPRPLVRLGAVALLAVLSIGAFAFLSSDAFAFYLDRLGLAEQPWPRRTHLAVDGFPADADGVRRMKVAKGSSFTLVVKADLGRQFETPRRVEVLYTLDDGSRGRGDTRRIGNATPGEGSFQEYQFTFENVGQSHTFDVVGRDERVLLGLRDDRIRGLRLDVVDSPGIFKKVLELDYPAYMQRSPASPEATSAMQIPRGTKIRIRATANKELVRVKVEDSALPEPVTIEIAADAKNRQEFEYAIPALDADRVLLFTLTDTDGITTPDRDRDRLSLVAVADEPPQVTVRLKGIGEAITPDANIPLAGEIRDDYGIGKVWFEHRVNDQDARRTSLADANGGKQALPVDQPLDVRPLGLQPTQSFTLWINAHDLNDLAQPDGRSGPDEGISTRFELKVVTPEDLRSILERDELRLRQRFEAIYAEMLRTRDLLARIDFSNGSQPAAQPAESASHEKAGTSQAEAAETAEKQEKIDTVVSGVDEPASEAGDDAPAGETDDETRANRRKLQTLKALHYVERAGHDVLSVATGFDDIHEQLVNNRLDSEEIKQRLQGDIATPLRQIGGPLLDDLAQRLGRVQAASADLKTGPAELRGAVKQADLVLVEMKQVLDRMKEIGDFNEVVEFLRELIRDQDQLAAKTKQQRQKQTLKILED